ncbi:MAG: uracil-DNA glycosylase family protein, partial [Candidatus Dormibacteraeota bacterium]|nr:uracil-DNA glycosylase family protein [Candidatus Dormibacteraeota bacterium]
DGQLEQVRPGLVILVGGLAHAAFPATRGRGLSELVGGAFDAAGQDHREPLGRGGRVRPVPGPWLVPLPHPSGASRWLNATANRDRLEEGLAVLSHLWPVVAESPGPIDCS